MKLINYKRGYNNTFDCSVHGTIEMNREEFDNVVEFLAKNNGWWYQSHSENFSRSMLSEDLARRVYIKNSRHIVQGFYVNIRVYATEALVKHFNLKGYKRGNYQLKVDTSIDTNFSYLNRLANAETKKHNGHETFKCTLACL